MAGTTGAQMETADEGGMARRPDGINGVRVGDRLVGGKEHRIRFPEKLY